MLCNAQPMVKDKFTISTKEIASDAADTGSLADNEADEMVEEDDEAGQADEGLPWVNITSRLGYDPVEPMFFMDALCMVPEFGPAIFGEESLSEHVHELGNCTRWYHNPVMDADIAASVFLSEAHVIDTSQFATLVLDKSSLNESNIPDSLYHFSNKKNKIWTPLWIMSGLAKEDIGLFYFRTRSSWAYWNFAVTECLSKSPEYSLRAWTVITAATTIHRIHREQVNAAQAAKKALPSAVQSSIKLANEAFDAMWVNRFGQLPGDNGHGPDIPIELSAVSSPTAAISELPEQSLSDRLSL
ncbi:hypothetical protein PENSPDRAFT_671633 [Peniophora sp. CONT]|nr:hypothetical protein PENSPDRAFT_671633 [Peniophora sp. CONT]